MPEDKKKLSPEERKVLLGLGFDCDDAQRRISVGKNFRLYGGCKTTHGRMQETAVKFNEHLNKKGKTLDDLCEEEFHEIAERIGLKKMPQGDASKSSDK